MPKPRHYYYVRMHSFLMTNCEKKMRIYHTIVNWNSWEWQTTKSKQVGICRMQRGRLRGQRGVCPSKKPTAVITLRKNRLTPVLVRADPIHESATETPPPRSKYIKKKQKNNNHPDTREILIQPTAACPVWRATLIYFVLFYFFGLLVSCADGDCFQPLRKTLST